MFTAQLRSRFFWLWGIILSSHTVWASAEELKTTLSAGLMSRHQQCSSCFVSDYVMMPLSLGFRQGGNSLKLSSSVMELKRPELDERYIGHGELVITAARDVALSSTKGFWGGEVKLKLATESEPELGNGSTDLQLGVKTMINLGSVWLNTKLARRWRKQGDSEPLFDSNHIDLGVSRKLNPRTWLGINTAYRNRTARIDQSRQSLTPYLSMRLTSQHRITAYIIHSKQGDIHELGGGLQYSYQL